MSETHTVCIDAQKLKVSTREIGRYAGGRHYKLDDRMQSLAAAVLERAKKLAKPVFTCTIHPVASIETQKGVLLESGSFVELPREEQDPSTTSLAATVCTLGPALENETQQLMQQGDLLTAMFLDAAGVVQLELLALAARNHIRHQAAECHLYAGCPFGPGYNGMPLDSQTALFEHVAAANIGVRLNESGVMLPMKSVSFWLRLTRDKRAAENHGYKCQQCEMENCLYRKMPITY